MARKVFVIYLANNYNKISHNIAFNPLIFSEVLRQRGRTTDIEIDFFRVRGDLLFNINTYIC